MTVTIGVRIVFIRRICRIQILLTYKRIENNVGKRENERLDNYFLHFPQYIIGNFSLGPFAKEQNFDFDHVESMYRW